MKTIFELLDEISHQLNSPLAGAKSYTYLSKRFLEKGDAKKAAGYLDLLDKKVDLITKRIDLIMTVMRLESEDVEFTYELFDFEGREILADKKALAAVMEYARELTGNRNLMFTGDKKTIMMTAGYKNRPESDDKDIRTELIEKAIIMHRIVRLHGGTIEDSEKELKIMLPLRPQRQMKNVELRIKNRKS
jgi:signal transduction histidine kinase